MKKLLALSLLLLTLSASAAQLIINCQGNPTLACSTSGPPPYTGTGDPPWLVNGKANTNFASLFASVATIPTSANPTGTVGLSTVNGVAATFLRSDGAPPLSQAIVPTWSGLHTFTGGVVIGSPTGGSKGANTLNSPLANTYLDGTLFQGIAPTWTGLHTFTGHAIEVGAPTSGDTGSGTINVATGYDINGVSQFQTGSFTGTFTGFTASSCSPNTNCTGTVNWTQVGSLVTLVFTTANTGTSNATSFTMTGLPTALQPTRAQQISMPFDMCEDNTAVAACLATMTASSGTITFAKNGLSGGWTSSGTKGMEAGGVTVMYIVN